MDGGGGDGYIMHRYGRVFKVLLDRSTFWVLVLREVKMKSFVIATLISGIAVNASPVPAPAPVSSILYFFDMFLFLYHLFFCHVLFVVLFFFPSSSNPVSPESPPPPQPSPNSTA